MELSDATKGLANNIHLGCDEKEPHPMKCEKCIYSIDRMERTECIFRLDCC